MGPRAHDPFGQHQASIVGADQKDRGLWDENARTGFI